VNEITVSPSGDLWITTATGYGRSDDGGRTWTEVSVPSRRMRLPENWFSDNLDRVTFFDERRAGSTGAVLRSDDHDGPGGCSPVRSIPTNGR
jgi:streptogramin lyase